jgi:hypothetical protein
METGRRSFLSSIVVPLVGVKGRFEAQTRGADSPGPDSRCQRVYHPA